MNRLMMLLPFVLLLILAACAGNPDENAVRGTVGNFERTLEEVIAGKAKPATLDDYFATPGEGANDQGLLNTRDAFRKMLNDHVNGVSIVQLSNFRITKTDVHESGGLAKVTYQVNIRLVHGTQQGTATLTQDLALLKTPRGWRISGGDPWRYNNVVGSLP
ncbi:MAG: nuclear transport factor 2 family protein [Anaerolineae bacterium]|nr:nuclear transport factor 2 family protein [Anaerolineae bacterium]